MNGAAPPAHEGPTGRPVDDREELYRCISPLWWVATEQRVSSAAFNFPVFSVDVASLAGSPEATLSRFRTGSGIAAFVCRSAKALGASILLEIDPNFPENTAHAHVHMPASSGKRKTAARKLVESCRVLIKPTSMAG